MLDGLLGKSWDDPKTMATLNLAAGLLGGGNFGQALGRGLQGYQQTMGQAQQNERLKRFDDMRSQEFEWDKRDQEAKVKAEDRQRQIDASVSEALKSGRANLQELAAAGVPMDRLKQIAELPNLGKSEVSKTLKGVGPDGREYEYMVDKFGQKVGEGLQQFRAPMMQDLGGQVIALDPYNLQPITGLKKSMTPDAQASNALGWANNAISRERLAFDRQGGAEAAKPQFRDGMWITPPERMAPGQAIPAIPQQGVKDATEALALIEQARRIIPSATGSGAGAAIDAANRFFGNSTQGDIATGQLQALEGALVAKMPKMSGPQSDKDVALYKQMAGVIGDPTMPRDRRMAALQTIEEIQRRYTGQARQAPQPGSMGSGTANVLPQDIQQLLNKY